MTPLRLHSSTPSGLPIDRAPRAARRVPHGFVLIGVVIMVLALTILGLSLFSLSSFEAQFMNRSLEESQALQFAMGGLDRSKFTLTVSPNFLSQVMDNLPYEHVTYARASQWKMTPSGPVLDSSGVVVEGGDDVNIRVTAEYQGITRTVEANYRPTMETNYYKRLITVGAGGLEVNDSVAISLPACHTVVLSDSIWANPAAPPVLACASGAFGVNARFVPIPLADLFIQEHTAGASPIPPNAAAYSLTLGAPGSVTYYYTNDPTSTPSTGFSSSYAFDASITVNGFAVWLLPHGLRISGDTAINAGSDPNACLVIIAQDGHDPSGDPGAIWLFGGVHASIPVILVSDGHVKIEQFQHPGDDSRADNLSIFSNAVLLTGPSEASGKKMRLSYTHSVMDPLIEQLMSHDALPNSVSSTPFVLEPGTWRVVQ